jgi:hypothetical protein
MNVPVPHGPDYFQFSTDEKMRAALAEIGFSKIETKFVNQHWHVRSGAQVLEVMRTGTVRAGAVVKRQSEEAFGSIGQFLDDTLATMRKNPAGGFDVPLPALIGSGEKK